MCIYNSCGIAFDETGSSFINECYRNGVNFCVQDN